MSNSDSDSEELVLLDNKLLALLDDNGQQRQLSDDEIKDKIKIFYKGRYPSMKDAQIDNGFAYIYIKTKGYVYKHNIRSGKFVSMAPIDRCNCCLL